jgi:hypothetical protein
MTESSLSPNPLAELYDSLRIILETIPAETHPAWELAIESVIFGGEGIAPGVVPYGEQQAKRNDFRMAAYRTQYGNGEYVTEFPALATQSPSQQDRQYISNDIQLPVAPDSGIVLPVFVDDDTLPEAVRLLNEFPTKPGAEENRAGTADLLNPDLFPGLTTSPPDQPATGERRRAEHVSGEHADLPPNELADLYDGLYTLLESLPSHADTRWQKAIESVLFGGPYLDSEAIPYGEQQAERNDFGMPDYRSKYGDETRVTEFPAIATQPPVGGDAQYVDAGVELPVTPDTRTTLPLAPAEDELADAARLLAEFPAAPDAEHKERNGGVDADALFDADAFLSNTDLSTQSGSKHPRTNSQRELDSGSGEPARNDLDSRRGDSPAESELSQQEQERLADVVALAPTSNGELASSWELETTKEAWEYLSQHLDAYYYRNENNRIEPTEEAVRIGSAAGATLSQQDQERLMDLIELAPTSNGELASSWDLNTAKEVWEYLSQHLDECYYRNDNSRIEPTEKALQLQGQLTGNESSTASPPGWVPDSGHDTSSARAGTESHTDEHNQSTSPIETSTETQRKDPESHTGSSTGPGLSPQEQERLAELIELAPTSNGELASSWDLDTAKAVWEYMSQQLEEYYYRNDNGLIEPTEEAVRIGTHTDSDGTSVDSHAESETDSRGTSPVDTDADADVDADAETDAKTRSERSQSVSPTETDAGTNGDGSESPSADSTVLRQESAGETTAPLGQQHESDSSTSRKYDDPQAERAHRQAQQRDPSDVVELGEEIKLTIKQADYSSRPPTIMGTKNRLVVFVIDAPQDLSEYETIKATVVDFGGKNNSAEAAFSGYVD